MQTTENVKKNKVANERIKKKNNQIKKIQPPTEYMNANPPYNRIKNLIKNKFQTHKKKPPPSMT